MQLLVNGKYAQPQNNHERKIQKQWVVEFIHAIPWKVHGNQIFEHFFSLLFVEHK
jgi:hypothetical protein